MDRQIDRHIFSILNFLFEISLLSTSHVILFYINMQNNIYKEKQSCMCMCMSIKYNINSKHKNQFILSGFNLFVIYIYILYLYYIYIYISYINIIYMRFDDPFLIIIKDSEVIYLYIIYILNIHIYIILSFLEFIQENNDLSNNSSKKCCTFQ